MEYEFLDVKMHEKPVETYLVIRLLGVMTHPI
jgi:hypothetical protein